MTAILSGNGVLGTVEVDIRKGGGAVETYVFPGMDLGELEKVLPKGSDRFMGKFSTLTLVNASVVVLSIPCAVIETVRVEGELWCSRA